MSCLTWWRVLLGVLVGTFDRLRHRQRPTPSAATATAGLEDLRTKTIDAYVQENRDRMLRDLENFLRNVPPPAGWREREQGGER